MCSISGLNQELFELFFPALLLALRLSCPHRTCFWGVQISWDLFQLGIGETKKTDVFLGAVKPVNSEVLG
jgi:hypothetical protein